MRTQSCVAILLMAVSAGSASAAPGQSLAQSEVYLDGRVARCSPYPIYYDPRLSDVAYASAANGGMLILNPNLLAQRPTEVKLFVFAHECGHLVTRGSEADADCWAIQTGKAQGWFTEQDFRYLMDDLWNSPGDIVHAPGPARLQHIQDCFDAV